MWESGNDPKYKNQSQETQTEDYANHLKKCKIVFVTSSLRRFALRKYVEAAMAGALLIGDLPAERQAEFRQYVVEINKGMSAAEIKAIVEKWLNDEPARLERAAIGQRISMEKYTYEHFLDGLIKGWKQFLLQGMRGFHFPHSFVMTKPWCIPIAGSPHDCGI